MKNKFLETATFVYCFCCLFRSHGFVPVFSKIYIFLYDNITVCSGNRLRHDKDMISYT